MGSPRQRQARVPGWVVDAGWAAAVAVVSTIAIRVAREPGARAPDLLAYALGWTVAALLLARRRWPVAVLMASFAILELYYALDYPGISAAVPLAVALYTAGAAGHLRWALLVPTVAVGGALGFLLFVDQAPVLPVVGEVVRDASLWLATLLLGDAVHSRRALAGEHRLLEAERARSERLLRNMLPEPIAARLKQREELIAERFQEVTVLFADIVGFTEQARRIPPEVTVALLNDLFSQFDALTEAHGLEKIKTVGDAYMVAGGLSDPGPDPPGAVAELALGMLEVVAHRNLPGGGPVRLRIGVDSGPVVAGVIGRRKLSYDLWGDTVNTASRMESGGVPGCVQVTERTRDLLGERYLFRERGRVQVKGKGAMRTYLLVGRADGQGTDGAGGHQVLVPAGSWQTTAHQEGAAS
jgi:class 3 adenylate cyclase